VNWTNASEWTLQTVRPQLDGSGMVREEIGYTVRRFVDEDAPPIFWGYRVMDPCATCLKHKFDNCRSLGTPSTADRCERGQFQKDGERLSDSACWTCIGRHN
jgi:hypothetical protein